jgi:hypothetical protein
VDETFEFDALGVLVGKNNAGKTNILCAMQLLIDGSDKSFAERDYNDPSAPIVVEGVFSNAPAYLPLSEERHRVRIAERLDVDCLRVQRIAPAADRAMGKLLLWNPETKAFEPSPAGIDGALKQVLPEVILIEAFVDPAAQADGKDTATFGKLLKQILAGVQADTDAALATGLATANALLNVVELPDGTLSDDRSTHLKEIEQRLSQFVADGFQDARARIKVDMPEVKGMLNKSRVQLSDGGPWTDVDITGQGQQRALYFALLRTLAAQRRSSTDGGLTRPFILLMEEPEAFLHPSAHPIMRAALETIASSNQVVYTTHSPSMVSPTRVTETIFVRKTPPGPARPATIRLRPLGRELEGKERRVQMLFEYPRSSKFLFTDSALVVEGDADVAILEAAFSHFTGLSFDDVSLSCIDAADKTVVHECMAILRTRGLETFGLVDLDFLWRGAGPLLTDKGSHSRFCDAFWKACETNALCVEGEAHKLKDRQARRRAAELALATFPKEIAAFRVELRDSHRLWVLAKGEIEVYAGLSTSAKGAYSTAAQEVRAGARALTHEDEIRELFDWMGLSAIANSLKPVTPNHPPTAGGQTPPPEAAPDPAGTAPPAG